MARNTLRARRTETGPDIAMIGRLFFTVASGSRRNVCYIVDAEPGEYSGCSCDGWQFHGHCKHMKLIKALIALAEEKAGRGRDRLRGKERPNG